MGGEVLLLMEKGEVTKLKKFFDENDNFEIDDGIYSLEAPTEGNGCWIEFKGGAKVEVGYQIFHMCSNWATAVACGIRQKFKVKKGGWDSVGYCDHFFETRPFKASIDIAKRYMENNPDKVLETMKQQLDEDTACQKIYEDRVKEIFQL